MIPIFKKFLSSFMPFNNSLGPIVYKTPKVVGELGNPLIHCIIRETLDGGGNNIELKFMPEYSDDGMITLNDTQARQLKNNLDECISQFSRLELNETEDE